LRREVTDIAAIVTPQPNPDAVVPRVRELVLVAGSGRSGTSLFSGLLQRLGYRVPQPEVPADETNPKGFAESQWVVDFHTRLLAEARVQTSDARPTAWAETAQITQDPGVRGLLRAWLDEQYGLADALVIKDPRLSWFLPLWRHAAEELGTVPRFVSMLRHPAAVVDSKQRYYGGRQGEPGRAAGWVNQLLYTERATRGLPRAFVRYDDLLVDWTRTVGQVADALELTRVRDAPAPALRRAHEFVDVTLSRSRTTWDGLLVPVELRDQADAVWALVSRLADGDDDAGVRDGLDGLRGDYRDYYAVVESIAFSSIAAAARPRRDPHPSLPLPVRRVLRRVPVRLRRSVPVGVRRAIVRRIGR
jgi:hypothetical protein